MYGSWINLMMLAAESQQVIWLRMMRLAAGGAKAQSEAQRMVHEKVFAAGRESGRMILGASGDSVQGIPEKGESQRAAPHALDVESQ